MGTNICFLAGGTRTQKTFFEPRLNYSLLHQRASLQPLRQPVALKVLSLRAWGQTILFGHVPLQVRLKACSDEGVGDFGIRRVSNFSRRISYPHPPPQSRNRSPALSHPLLYFAKYGIGFFLRYSFAEAMVNFFSARQNLHSLCLTNH